MAHRVAGRIQSFQLHGSADPDGIPRLERHIDAFDGSAGTRMGIQRGPGGLPHAGVAPGVVQVLMRVDEFRNGPTAAFGFGQAEVCRQRIHGERFAGFFARDQVVEIAVSIVGVDLCDLHLNSDQRLQIRRANYRALRRSRSGKMQLRSHRKRGWTVEMALPQNPGTAVAAPHFGRYVPPSDQCGNRRCASRETKPAPAW